jgi:hypothetical protein
MVKVREIVHNILYCRNLFAHPDKNPAHVGIARAAFESKISLNQSTIYNLIYEQSIFP